MDCQHSPCMDHEEDEVMNLTSLQSTHHFPPNLLHQDGQLVMEQMRTSLRLFQHLSLKQDSDSEGNPLPHRGNAYMGRVRKLYSIPTFDDDLVRSEYRYAL